MFSGSISVWWWMDQRFYPGMIFHRVMSPVLTVLACDSAGSSALVEVCTLPVPSSLESVACKTLRVAFSFCGPKN